MLHQSPTGRRSRCSGLLVMVGGLCLTGCSQGSVLSYKSHTGAAFDSGGSASSGGSTGEVIEQDPDYGDDGGSGSGSGAGSDGDASEPTYDTSQWSGSRTYSIDKRSAAETDCTGDSVDEAGIRIEDADQIAALEEHCPVCADFYELTYQSTAACGGDIDLSGPEVRGFVYRGADLEIWRITGTGSAMTGERELNDGDYADGTASYSYDRDWNGDGTTTITGTLSFPVVE